MSLLAKPTIKINTLIYEAIHRLLFTCSLNVVSSTWSLAACSWRWHCSIKYPSSIILLWTIHLILVHELHSNNNNCNRSRPLLVNSLNRMPFHQTHFPLISRFYYSLISTHVTEKLFPPPSFIQLSCHGAYDGAS